MTLDGKSVIIGALLGAVLTFAGLAAIGSLFMSAPSAIAASENPPPIAVVEHQAASQPITTKAAPRQHGNYQINGEGYSLAANANGAVLTSMSDGRRISLGTSCDVLSDRYGAGRWEWSNGGFAIIFAEEKFSFPRMDAPIDTDDCRAE